MLRQLAYLFTYRVDTGLSLTTKLYIPATIMLFLILAINPNHILLASIQLVAILAIELSILLYIGSLKNVASAIVFIAIFIVLGLITRTLSIILGYEPANLEDMVVSTIRVVEFFLAITIAFQWIKISEYSWFLKKMGLTNIATLVTITLTQLSPILVAYSEALTTIRLKYGGKVLQKAVKPLIIYSINYGRDVAEAVYMYGIPELNIQFSIKEIDVALMMVTTAVLVLLGIMPKIIVGLLL
ncbi:MAG: hypothetical protein QXJ56_03465 [Ignisphaera sp.]